MIFSESQFTNKLFVFVFRVYIIYRSSVSLNIKRYTHDINGSEGLMGVIWAQ